MFQNRHLGTASAGSGGGPPAPTGAISAQAKSLEQTRQRYLLVESLLRDLLAQIENPAASTAAGRETSSGMASWPTLLRSFKLIAQALSDLMTSSFPLTGNLTIPNPLAGAGAAAISSSGANDPANFSVALNANTPLHVYPQNTFPGRSQESILNLLLRKKWTPSVVGWVDDADEANDLVSKNDPTKPTYQHQLSSFTQPSSASHRIAIPDFAALWEWAGPAGNNVAQRVLMGEDDDDVDDDDDEEEDEGDDDDYEEDQGDQDGGDEAGAAGIANAGGSHMMDIDQPPADPANAPAGPVMSMDAMMRFMYMGQV